MPDGRPVHCRVRLGSSGDERERHVQLLAALARAAGIDAAFQEELCNANSLAPAYELLNGEES